MITDAQRWYFRKKSGKIKTGYKQEYVNVNADVDFDFAGPTIHGAAVVGWAFEHGCFIQALK